MKDVDLWFYIKTIYNDERQKIWEMDKILKRTNKNICDKFWSKEGTVTAYQNYSKVV